MLNLIWICIIKIFIYRYVLFPRDFHSITIWSDKLPKCIKGQLLEVNRLLICDVSFKKTWSHPYTSHSLGLCWWAQGWASDLNFNQGKSSKFYIWNQSESISLFLMKGAIHGHDVLPYERCHSAGRGKTKPTCSKKQR